MDLIWGDGHARPPIPNIPARHMPDTPSRLPLRFSVLCAFLSLSACSAGSEPTASPATTSVSITVQPQDMAVDAGSNATFSVSVAGDPPVAFQWRRDGSDIAGATSSTHTLPSVSGSDNGAQFSVRLSNSVSTLTSSVARLTVRTAPTLTAQPQHRAVLSGVPATFSVTASGSSLTYVWKRNGIPIPGATRSSYSVGFPLAGDSGAVYSVAVSNSVGSVTSTNASLTVNSGTGTRPTSFGNAKARNLTALVAPVHVHQTGRAFADFFGDGQLGLFTATLVYDWNRPEAEARQGELQFWRASGGTYVRDTAKVDNATGCIHPRTAVVADFNADQRPDVFLVCHGYDRAPFPGEANRLVLSQPGGLYTNRAVGPVGFYHGVTAMDVNNDGHVDVVVTDTRAQQSVFVYANDGQGNFVARSDLVSLGRKNYFTLGAADVDGDGRTDLLVGGHDWEGASTAVLLNTGTGSFAAVTPVILPAVPNEGVVLDFSILDAGRDGVNEIYVLRTSGGDGTFYQSRTVQKVEWPSLAATVLVTGRPATWIPFIQPVFTNGVYRLVPDVPIDGFSVAIP